MVRLQSLFRVSQLLILKETVKPNPLKLYLNSHNLNQHDLPFTRRPSRIQEGD